MVKLKIMRAIAAATVTIACAPGSHALTDASYSQGWRRALVVAIGTDQLVVRSSKEDCRTARGAEAGFTRFAMASYSFGGNPNLREQRIVAIPNDVDVKVGDWVAISITDCRLALNKLGTAGKHY